MYRVMIVDDEPIIRKGLIHFIEWNTLECEIICEASDGLTAKNMLQTHNPHIVITDIKMPGLDGIQLTKYIYDHYPHTKVILLTGHSDFDYAQSAIQYDVVDFVLKPSSTEKIIQAVDKSIKQIEQEVQKDDKIFNLQKQVHDHLDQLQEKFFYDRLKGFFIDPMLLHLQLQQLGIHIPRYCVLIFKIQDPNCSLIELKSFLNTSFENKHHTLIMDAHSLCSIVYLEKIHSIKDMILKSREILDFTHEFLHLSVSIGISNIHENLDELSLAYEEACKAYSLYFYEDGHIFTFEDFHTPYCHFNQQNLQDCMHTLSTWIQKDNKQEAVKTLEHIFYTLKSLKLPIHSIKNISMFIYSLCLRHLNDFDFLDEKENEFYHALLNCQSISKLEQQLKDKIHSLPSSNLCMDPQKNQIIHDALEYLKQHYPYPIRLNELANHVHVNSSYLSRLFKNKTGKTITEMLTHFRIEKAKSLLGSQNMKASEVAYKVGIEDPAYFSQVFKKYTGQSPSDYKKSLSF